MTIIARTKRLTIRRLEPEDAPFFRELVNTPGWVQFIGQRNIHTDAEALAYLEGGIFKSYRESGYGFYMVELTDGQLPLGINGIVLRGSLPGPDFGFAFLPQYMGKGYAVESSEAVLSHVKNDLVIEELYAISLPENERSLRLLEKLGFQNQGPIELNNETLLLYRKEL